MHSASRKPATRRKAAGRPRIDDASVRRDRIVSVRFTAPELESVVAGAKLRRWSVSQFVQLAAVDAAQHPEGRARETPRRRGEATPLGRWIRDQGETYAGLAKRAGMARSTLILVATGKRVPSTKHIAALTHETGLSFESLMDSPSTRAALRKWTRA